MQRCDRCHRWGKENADPIASWSIDAPIGCPGKSIRIKQDAHFPFDPGDFRAGQRSCSSSAFSVVTRRVLPQDFVGVKASPSGNFHTRRRLAGRLRQDALEIVDQFLVGRINGGIDRRFSARLKISAFRIG